MAAAGRLTRTAAPGSSFPVSTWWRGTLATSAGVPAASSAMPTMQNAPRNSTFATFAASASGAAWPLTWSPISSGRR